VSTTLTTQSTGGTTLTGTGNKIGTWNAFNSGSGTLRLTNTGLINVTAINDGGDFNIDSFGGVVTKGQVKTSGAISITSNSPLTVGDLGLVAGGDITLIATNLTSAGNITLNGNITSASGAVAITAASDLIQNSTVTAALGLTTTAAGTVTFGPNAKSNGNPVKYAANGVVLYPPGVGPGTQSAVAASAQVDFVATFLDKFEQAITAQSTLPQTPQEKSDKEKKETGLAVEGQSCTP
jgi:hypothetical protein